MLKWGNVNLSLAIDANFYGTLQNVVRFEQTSSLCFIRILNLHDRGTVLLRQPFMSPFKFSPKFLTQCFDTQWNRFMCFNLAAESLTGDQCDNAEFFLSAPDDGVAAVEGGELFNVRIRKKAEDAFLRVHTYQTPAILHFPIATENDSSLATVFSLIPRFCSTNIQKLNHLITIAARVRAGRTKFIVICNFLRLEDFLL